MNFLFNQNFAPSKQDQFENPYEGYGYLHTEALNATIRDTMFPFNNPAKIFRWMSNYFKRELKLDARQMPTMKEFEKGYALLKCPCDYSSLPNRFVDEKLMDPKLIPYAQSLTDILGSSNNVFKVQQNYYSFENFINSSLLSKSEKEMFYFASVIGRHSIMYWLHQSLNPNSPWIQGERFRSPISFIINITPGIPNASASATPEGGGKPSPTPCQQVGPCICADMYGALFGFILGGIILDNPLFGALIGAGIASAGSCKSDAIAPNAQLSIG